MNQKIYQVGSSFEGKKFIEANRRNASIEIGDFKYIDGDTIFNIQYNKDKYVMPKTLYKYYSLSKNSIEAITTPYLYASHPNQLNDPLDCHKDIIEIDDNTLREFWGPLYEQVLHELGSEEVSGVTPAAFKMIAYKMCGLFSMAESLDNELMWSHYAQKNGFCIELDINSVISSLENGIRAYGPFPINYQERLYQISTSQIGVNAAMAIQCTIKRKAWAYENEWRLIVTNQNGKYFKGFGDDFCGLNLSGEHDRKIRYSIKSIKKIIFQQPFFKEEKILLSKDDMVDFEISCLYKRLLLDFAINNNIPTSIRWFSPKDEVFVDVSISKIDDTKYGMIKVEEDKG